MNKYCYNYNGHCEEDHCYCADVSKALKDQQDNERESKLRFFAGRGYKWAQYQLFNQFGDDGDGIFGHQGYQPR